MNQLVYYSLLIPPSEPRPDLLRQVLSSVQSLRAYNRTVPAVVFVHGDPLPELARALRPYHVHVHLQGAYESRLERLCPDGWRVLAHYPLLHKFLNFREISALAPRQVLFLDCDTLFFDDVARIFRDYGASHCCAREEPTCSRSPFGYDRNYIDEDALARLAWSQSIRPVPPFNLGVVLFNHGVWRTLADLDRTLIGYAWRLLLWLARHPSDRSSALYGEGAAVRLLRQHLGSDQALAASQDALPFPSANGWIVDQVALWLTLGHIPALTYADFSPNHVLQDGEILTHRSRQPGWVLCHYFSQNMSRVENWLYSSASTPQN